MEVAVVLAGGFVCLGAQIVQGKRFLNYRKAIKRGSFESRYGKFIIQRLTLSRRTTVYTDECSDYESRVRLNNEDPIIYFLRMKILKFYSRLYPNQPPAHFSVTPEETNPFLDTYFGINKWTQRWSTFFFSPQLNYQIEDGTDFGPIRWPLIKEPTIAGYVNTLISRRLKNSSLPLNGPIWVLLRWSPISKDNLKRHTLILPVNNDDDRLDDSNWEIDFAGSEKEVYAQVASKFGYSRSESLFYGAMLLGVVSLICGLVPPLPTSPSSPIITTDDPPLPPWEPEDDRWTHYKG